MSEKTQIPSGKAVFNSTTGIELAQRFEASGLGLAAFARQEGMSKARLDYWVRKAKKQGAIGPNSTRANPAASGFFVLQPDPGRAESTAQVGQQSAAAVQQVVLMVVPIEANALKRVLDAVGIGGQ